MSLVTAACSFYFFSYLLAFLFRLCGETECFYGLPEIVKCTGLVLLCMLSFDFRVVLVLLLRRINK